MALLSQKRDSDPVWALSPESVQKSTEIKLVKALTDMFDELRGQPIRGDTSIRVENIRFDERKRKYSNDIAGQREAKVNDKSFSIPLVADVYIEEDGKVVDKAVGAKLADLPVMTDRLSYLVGGRNRPTAEVQMAHLMRQRHGLFTTADSKGNITTQATTGREGIGAGFRFELSIDPQGVMGFKPTRRGAGSLRSPPMLYPLLKAMGVSDENMKRKWGKAVYAANVEKWDRRIKSAGVSEDELLVETLDGLANHIWKNHPKAPADPVDRRRFALENINSMQLDPLTSLVLLGKRYEKMEPSALLQASSNLVNTVRGDRSVDDRISLAFQKVSGPDDLVSESFYDPKFRRQLVTRIRGKLSRGAKGKVERKIRARDILRGLVADPIKNLFLYSSVNDLSSQPSMINPVDFLSEATKITPISQTHGGLRPDIVRFEQKLISPSHLTFLDPLKTPESDRAGITLHMTVGTKRSNRGGIGVIESELWDMKARKLRDITPAEVQAGAVAYPDQYTWSAGRPIAKSRLVNAQRGSKMVRIPPEDVDYIIPYAHKMFTVATNLVPFMGSNHGNRVTMAAKQMPQAVSLVAREAPLIQVKVPGSNTSFEKAFGRYASASSPVSGKVRAVEIDKKRGTATIVVKPRIGKSVRIPLYYKYPLREHSMLDSDVLVKVGDRVSKGQLLADTNFTKGGALALGKNLVVAYMPWKGKTFEDGIVISESAAKKLTSKHMYEERFEVEPTEQYADPKRFAAKFKDKLRPTKFDDYSDGVIRKGSTLAAGQPIATLLSRDPVSAKKMRGSKGRGVNASVYWEGNTTAKVVDVIARTRRRGGKPVIEYTVLLETEEPAEVGDKLTNRHAAKGVITDVVPDSKMPRRKSGAVVDVLFNPAGIPSRVNIGQVLETGLAKVIQREKRSGGSGVELVENFSGDNNLEYVLSRLKKAGISDQEVLIDPETDRPFGKGKTVMVGPQYILKLKHQVAGKLKTRNIGKVNRTTGAPSGDARRLGELNFYSMLSHGARDNLEEMARIKGGGPFDGEFSWNQGVYDAIVEGSPIPRISARQHPVWDKFESYLNVMGVDLEKDGERLQVLPLTDKQLLSVSKGALSTGTASLAQYGKGYVETPGSLYDPARTGGIHGTYWSHYKLPQKFPKPIYAKSISYLLGLTKAKDQYSLASQKAVSRIVAGEDELNGLTGPEAILKALEALDVDKELSNALKMSRDKDLAVDERDYQTRRVRVLRALKAAKISPVEAYTTQIVPVLPPKFRPLKDEEDQSRNPLNRYYMALAADLNSHDGVLIDAKKAGVKIRDKKATVLLTDSRKSIYESLKALQGLVHGPSSDSAKRYLKEGDKGVLEVLLGQSPKRSFFQEEVMKRRQDFTAGSVIIPEPSLGLDEIGIPEDIAWTLYAPFVMRRLRRSGAAKKMWGPNGAKSLVDNRDPIAMEHLKREMEERPILFKRDPTLHKYGIMAFKPRLNYQKKPGDPAAKAIQIHPLVTAPLNADFDGDQATLYLPLEEKARLEAYRMMPSANLFGPATNLPMFIPSQEALLGLYMLSKPGKKTGIKFGTSKDAITAMHRNEVSMDDVIVVGGKETTAGRLVLDRAFSSLDVPEGLKKELVQFGNVSFKKQRVYTKGELRGLLTKVGKEYEDHFAKVADTLKNLGYRYSTQGGFSVSLADFKVLHRTERDKIFKEARKIEDKIRRTGMDDEKKEKAIISLYKGVDAKLEMSPRGKAAEKKSILAGTFKSTSNRLFDMIRSGSRGDTNALQQMVAAPVLVMSADNKIVPVPILRSYSEGLDAGSYMTSLHGARKGVIQKVQTVRDPGMVSKHIIKATMDMLVTETDCKTKKGIELSLEGSTKGKSSPADVRGRYLARSISTGAISFRSGSLVTETLLSDLKKAGTSTVYVRSALTCEARHGVCSRCAGIGPSGNPLKLGTNVGVIAGQSIGEPLTQMSMRVFHGGGLAKGKAAGSQNLFLKFQKLVDVRQKRSPEHVPLAQFKGKVVAVKRLPAGSYKIKIEPLVKGKQVKSYTILPHMDSVEESDLLVERSPLDVGTIVQPGDRLAKTGEIHPLDYLDATGDLPALQELLVDEIHGALIRGADEHLLRKHTEVVVRALTDRLHVEDAGKHPTLLYGDVVRSGAVKKLQKESGGSLKLRPMLLSAVKVPRVSDDFLVRLQATHLKQGILDAAQYGFKSYVNGFHPVPAYGWGAKFNQAPHPAIY